MMLVESIWTNFIMHWQIIKCEQWCVFSDMKPECGCVYMREHLMLNQFHVRKATAAFVAPHLIYFYVVCHLPDVCSAPGKQRAFKKGRKENQYLCPFWQPLTAQWRSCRAGEKGRLIYLRDPVEVPANLSKQSMVFNQLLLWIQVTIICIKLWLEETILFTSDEFFQKHISVL